jgi:aminoglycoside phosphotransferase (APT) family kinase protein
LERRAAAAAAAVEAEGLAPVRLAGAVGGDWYIVQWGGTKLGDGRPARTSPEDVGRFIARLHQVPTDWFAPYATELLRLLPQLGGARPGSHPWWFSAWSRGYGARGRERFAWRHVTADEVEAWAHAAPKPASAIGSRLVTSHGDLKGGNILLSPDASLCAIDFECSGVFEAAFDLGSAFVMLPALLRTAADKRAFVRAYIEQATGQPASTDEVAALAIDAEAATLTFPHCSPLSAFVYFSNPERYERMVATTRKVLDQARGDAVLCEKLLTKSALRFVPGWWIERSLERARYMYRGTG